MSQKFWWVLLIQGLCWVLEVTGGLLFGSLALLSDSLHILGDLFAVTIAFLALRLSQKKLPTDRMSYGYHRLEVFSALLNGVLLVAMAVLIFLTAWKRLIHPPTVLAGPSLVVGLIGFAGNLAAAMLLRGHDSFDRDINVRAVYWHLLGDMLSSLAVVFGMIGIALTGNTHLDTFASLAIALLLFYNAVRVLIEGTGILLQQSPHDLSLIREKVRSIPHVLDMDDFRLWQVCSHLLIGTAHIITDVKRLEDTEELDHKIKKLLEEKYHVRHLTLQFETSEMSEQHRHELNHLH